MIRQYSCRAGVVSELPNRYVFAFAREEAPRPSRAPWRSGFFFCFGAVCVRFLCRGTLGFYSGDSQKPDIGKEGRRSGIRV
ncbi:hypothetical protein ANANG_G00124700 [Anguilla anguilla]|uniref:Uncharacterized protein n=1 Tax=Anguilla anguilla TaxID=7936 RepID=A0A9D3MER5_ANGAN|nr:hypothetical protein ANANG_G00124700 [Anguilla anguilla]